MPTTNLPQLRGTPAQVKWAESIRANTLDGGDTVAKFAQEQQDLLAKINDSTWWIANRDPDAPDQLNDHFKRPAPHQLVGGPPPPPKTKESKGQRPLPLEAETDPDDPNREPHEVELFAASVCHTPALAELAVVASMARLYKQSGHIEEAATMRHRVEQRLECLRDDLIEAIDKDIAGIRRILGKK